MSQHYLGKKGYTTLRKEITSNELSMIRNQLMVKPFCSFNTNVQSFPVYAESPNKLYLPRYYGIQNLGSQRNVNYIHQQVLL